MLNLRTDAEFIKSVRGYAGVMYSARIPSGDRSAFDVLEGVPNGTFLSLGALETGEREIRVAGKPKVNDLPYMVIRAEVNPAEYVKTDSLFGKFRIGATKPLPVAKLSVGDFIGLSGDYFSSVDLSAMAVGQKFCLDATKYVAGQQLVKNASPTTGNVVFEVVEIKDNMIPNFLLADGTLNTPYKMVSLEIKIA